MKKLKPGEFQWVVVSLITGFTHKFSIPPATIFSGNHAKTGCSFHLVPIIADHIDQPHVQLLAFHFRRLITVSFFGFFEGAILMGWNNLLHLFQNNIKSTTRTHPSMSYSLQFLLIYFEWMSTTSRTLWQLLGAIKMMSWGLYHWWGSWYIFSSTEVPLSLHMNYHH